CLSIVSVLYLRVLFDCCPHPPVLLSFPTRRSSDLPSQYGLGSMYVWGIGAERDYEKAKYWLEKSANANYDKAQFTLGMLYEHGYGVTKNPSKATQWYRKACDNNNADACRNLR